jgi:8-oxo-dGTP pyrophosphatase MutT (NUDIX family)
MEISLPKFDKEILKEKGRFRKLSSFEYILPSGKIISCDSSNLINNDHIKYAHGVGALAIIKQTKQIIITENYRFPIEKNCLEFPAGIFEAEDIENSNKSINEIAIESAKKELKEEAGYDGDFVCFLSLPKVECPPKFFGEVFSDPWTSKDSTVMALFSIDLEKNKQHNQHLEIAEIVKVCVVDLDKFIDFLCEKAKEGYAIRIELYMLALGLNFDNFFDFE